MNKFYHTVIFLVLLFVTVISYSVTFFKNANHYWKIPLYKDMNFIVEGISDISDDIKLKINDNIEFFDNISSQEHLSYVYPFIYNKKITNTNVKKLSLLIKNNAENKIKRIIISNDSKLHYFKNLSDFQKENFQNYTKYNVPDKVKYRNFHNYSYNYTGNINAICSIFSSFFSKHNQLHTFIPYILAFITLLYFICNKNKIFIPSFFVTAFVFVFFFFMCYNGLFDYFPYEDEISTNIPLSSHLKPFLLMFNDPGNPPFYYVLLKIFNILFGFSVIKIRCLLLFLSVSFIFSLWFLVKNNYDKNIANLAAFMACLNAPLIMYCQIIRSYGLQILLTPLIIWVLFNIIEKNRLKDYIIYGVLTIIAVNTHYYEILFILGNFLFILFYFVLKKRFSDIKKFLVANFIGVLSFLPFFFHTALKKALLVPSFNNWISSLFSTEYVIDTVFWLFGSGITFVIFCFLFICLTVYKKKELPLLTVYCFYIVSFTIISAILFSLIRSIFLDRYFVFLTPAIIIYFVSFINLIKNNKFILVIYSIVICFIISFYTDRINSYKIPLFPKLSSSDEIVISFLTNYIKNENLYDNAYFIAYEEFMFSFLINYIKIENIFDNVYITPTKDYRQQNFKEYVYCFSPNFKYEKIASLQYFGKIDDTINKIFKQNNKAIIFSLHPLEHENNDIKTVIYPVIIPTIQSHNNQAENLYKYTLKNNDN